jgi:hypothetical protein
MNTKEAVSTGFRPYTLAGWLSILNAIILLPRVGFDFFMKVISPSGGTGIVQLITGFQVVGEFVGIYVLFMFQRLLNERHSFHNADLFIRILIITYAASAIAGTAGLFLIPVLDTMFVRVVLYLLSSFVSIVYAIRLLKLESDLGGLLKPYVYSTIAGGVCGATLVLGEYGRPIFMVSLILLGMILIRAESEPEYL